MAKKTTNYGLIALVALVIIGLGFLAYRLGWLSSLGLGARFEGDTAKTDGEICYGTPKRTTAKEGEGGEDVPGVTCTDTPTIVRTSKYITTPEFLIWARTSGFMPTGPIEEYAKCFVGKKEGKVVWAPKGLCELPDFQQEYKETDPSLSKCTTCVVKS